MAHSKEIRQQIRTAALYNFQLHRCSGKHLVFHGPGGAIVTTSKSASDVRSSKNFVARLRRFNACSVSA